MKAALWKDTIEYCQFVGPIDYHWYPRWITDIHIISEAYKDGSHYHAYAGPFGLEVLEIGDYFILSNETNEVKYVKRDMFERHFDKLNSKYACLKSDTFYIRYHDGRRVGIMKSRRQKATFKEILLSPEEFKKTICTIGGEYR